MTAKEAIEIASKVFDERERARLEAVTKDVAPLIASVRSSIAASAARGEFDLSLRAIEYTVHGEDEVEGRGWISTRKTEIVPGADVFQELLRLLKADGFHAVYGPDGLYVNWPRRQPEAGNA
jgi:hypothetical protein